jgi:hypothetical protein
MFTYIPPGIFLALLILLPLSWKWQLGIVRMVAITVVMGLLSGLIIALITVWVQPNFSLQIVMTWLLAVGTVFAYLVYRFYREPERTMPELPDIIISPADGL